MWQFWFSHFYWSNVFSLIFFLLFNFTFTKFQIKNFSLFNAFFFINKNVLINWIVHIKLDAAFVQLNHIETRFGADYFSLIKHRLTHWYSNTCRMHVNMHCSTLVPYPTDRSYYSLLRLNLFVTAHVHLIGSRTEHRGILRTPYNSQQNFSARQFVIINHFNCACRCKNERFKCDRARSDK